MTIKELYPDIYKVHGTTDEHARQRVFFAALRDVLRTYFAFDPDNSTTTDAADFPANFGVVKKGTGVDTDLRTHEKLFFVSVAGLLLANNATDPTMARVDIERPRPGDRAVVWKDARGTHKTLATQQFISEVTSAVQEFNASKETFGATHRVLLLEGKSFDGTETTVYARQVAQVAQRLVTQEVDPSSPQIRRYVINALSEALGGLNEGTRGASIDVGLPDLDAGVAADIVAENVKAVALIYASAMLEEMKLFAVVDKVAEHFMSGMLPISRGLAGQRIYEWIKKAPNRLSEIERRSVYGRTLGVAQGAARVELVNREFQDLWARFLSSVNVLKRETVDATGAAVMRGFVPTLWPEQVTKNARDLAVNVSVHGYGVAHFAAVEMQGLIHDVIDILRASDVLNAYGVNDHWQVVERVSQLYLGGSMNSVRYRTMADAGFNVLDWLAGAAPSLTPTNTLAPDFFLRPALTGHVDRWLAVTGTPDATIARLKDTVDLNQQPTIPQMGLQSALPASVRSALDRVGMGNLPNIGQA